MESLSALTSHALRAAFALQFGEAHPDRVIALKEYASSTLAGSTRRVTYTYRVFIETEDADTDAMHYASEKLYEGAIFRVNKPGTLIHGRPVIIYQVDNHPGDETPGIAHARIEGV